MSRNILHKQMLYSVVLMLVCLVLSVKAQQPYHSRLGIVEEYSCASVV